MPQSLLVGVIDGSKKGVPKMNKALDGMSRALFDSDYEQNPL